MSRRAAWHQRRTATTTTLLLEDQMSWRVSLLVEVLLTVFTVLPSATASADTIKLRISEGAIDAQPNSVALSSSIDIRSDSAFSLIGGSGFGSTRALCGPCVPGDTISLSAVIAPPIGGTLRYRGQVFTLGFDIVSGGRGGFQLTAPTFVLPVSPAGTATFTSPFTFSGNVLSTTEPDSDVFELTGAGTVTGSFDVFPLEGLPGGEEIVNPRLHFQFENAAATPEPATILLCGSGIVGTLVRRRRQLGPSGE